jgi:methionine-rich copper-binding protein CopC
MPLARPVCAILSAAVLWSVPGPASAHALLLDSRPASGATVPAGHVAFLLRYNSRIDAARSRLTLTAPDGAVSVLPIAPAGPPDVLAAEADLPAGSYSLRWQVLAADGHITRGDVPFTLTVPASP